MWSDMFNEVMEVLPRTVYGNVNTGLSAVYERQDRQSSALLDFGS